MSVLEQCAISSSTLLLGTPRRLSRCPTGMSLDNHIAISNALSNGHKSPPLRLFDMAASANFVKWSIMTSI